MAANELRFSKEKWLISANRQKENGYISQSELDDALNLWVNDLDGKLKTEIESEGNHLNDEWFV